MCVQLGMYPLVELETGKRKVLLNYGVAIENRDFDALNKIELSWRLALKGRSLSENFNQAVKKYGITKFEKFVNVPCGHCEQCLKSKARGWAFRILKEAEKYNNNFFITFTYDDKHLPVTYHNQVVCNTLVKDEISKFNKKLKTYLKRNGLNSDFRFYGVGEYGSNTLRPHYHVIYFNLDLPDLKFFNYSNGNLVFTSEFLNSVWSVPLKDKNGKVIKDDNGKVISEPKGFVEIGAVDIGSACYVARYCDKKLDRPDAQKVVLSSYGIVPEFSVMSRRPGIASDYLDNIIENFKNGCYSLNAKGNDFSIPIYYSKKIKEILKDTCYLEDYEKRNNLLIKNKINRDLLLSDLISSSSLQDYYLSEDAFKKSCKRSRDIL